jgi:hypothetical protein
MIDYRRSRSGFVDLRFTVISAKVTQLIRLLYIRSAQLSAVLLNPGHSATFMCSFRVCMEDFPFMPKHNTLFAELGGMQARWLT